MAGDSTASAVFHKERATANVETAKAVKFSIASTATPLKRGVNERDMAKDRHLLALVTG